MVLSLNATSLNREAQAIIAQVKAQPLKAEHRVALANVRLLQGQYHKALQQMQVACQSDVEWVPQAQLVKMLVQGETARQAVFAGQIQADLMSPAPAWLELLMQSLRGQQTPQQVRELRQQALELAPETPGTLNKSLVFQWLSDGDERLGPVLEVYTAARYFWLPVEHIASLQLQAQGHVLDLLWLKVTILMRDAKLQKITGYVPVRYPSSPEQAGDSEFETEWLPGLSTDGWQGRGQRVWYVDGEAVAMNEVTNLEFDLSSSQLA